MKDYLKFISRLPKPLRLRVIKAITALAEDRLGHLDIKKLSGTYDLYRCRVGKVRIIFQKLPDECIIHDVGFRGNIYD